MQVPFLHNSSLILVSNGESYYRMLGLFSAIFFEFTLRPSHTILLNSPRSYAEYRIISLNTNSLQLVLCCLAYLLLISLHSPTTHIGRGSLRKYILLTLSHVECTETRRELSTETIINRLTRTFVCKSIVISKESHTSLGYHYHVGLWNESASKHTASSKLRNLFPEFEGRQLDVSFHKGWNTVCTYLLKEDAAPTVWGEERLEIIKRRADAAAGKHRAGSRSSEIAAI